MCNAFTHESKAAYWAPTTCNCEYPIRNCRQSSFWWFCSSLTAIACTCSHLNKLLIHISQQPNQPTLSALNVNPCANCSCALVKLICFDFSAPASTPTASISTLAGQCRWNSYSRSSLCHLDAKDNPSWIIYPHSCRKNTLQQEQHDDIDNQSCLSFI